ncbi:MAG: hypothetical protein HOC74_34025 [Gemmatimonadetes bacterium]|nr:hypothetical protein [Gemmatimonadota bacterium]
MFRAIVLLCCVVVIPVYGYSAGVELLKISDPLDGDPFWFLAGALLAWTAYLLRPVSLLRLVLLHELSHSLVGWLLGARVVEIDASGQSGGKTIYDYPFTRGRELIALAPYYLQIVPLLLVALKTIVRTSFHPALSFAVGFAWLGFFFDLWITLKAEQTDILKTGAVFSSIVIFAANIVVSGVVLTSVSSATSPLAFLWTGVPKEIWGELFARLSTVF